MTRLRRGRRRQIDKRLTGLDTQIGPRPPRGWLWTIRDALGMSTYEFGRRIGVSATRVRQLEIAEVDGKIRLGVLEKTAEALNCGLAYVLVPKEPLDQMVKRQALLKAGELASFLEAEVDLEERALLAEVIAEEVGALALRLMDRRGLWSDSGTVQGRSPFRELVLERRFPP
jgi:predicted DNA-binding mobile mystery protein A